MKIDARRNKILSYTKYTFMNFMKRKTRTRITRRSTNVYFLTFILFRFHIPIFYLPICYYHTTIAMIIRLVRFFIHKS